jgi:GPH family glycoside/pentoside/hexuronide:cation symporter
LLNWFIWKKDDPSSAPKLTALQLVTYSLGGLGMNLTNLVVSQWLFERYVVGGVLAPAVFSFVLLAGRITDGVSDPFVAFWTDNARTRRGRRMPFLLFGALPFAIVCLFLWTPPVGAVPWIRTIYFLMVTQLYFLGYALVVTPYLALLPEIAGATVQRLNLTTGQAIAAMVGTLIFAMSGLVIQSGGYVALGWMLAIAVLISFYPLIFCVREHFVHQDENRNSFGQLFVWIVQVARSRNFWPLLVSTTLYWFSLNLLLMLVPRWVDEILHLKRDADTWVMLPFIGLNLIGFFIFNWLAKRIGKFRGFLIVLGSSALIFPLIALAGLLPIGSPLLQAQIALALAGLPVAGFAVLPFALLSDVIDLDSEQSRIRREAIYFGVQAIFQKSMIGVSVVCFAWIHERTGPTGLGWIALTAGAACALGLMAFCFYPVRR